MATDIFSIFSTTTANPAALLTLLHQRCELSFYTTNSHSNQRDMKYKKHSGH